MKDLKFRVRNEAHSKAIQERLFELGFTWAGYEDRELRHLKQPFLFKYKNSIAWGNDRIGFNTHPHTETTLDDLYNDEFLKAKQPNYLGAWFGDVIGQLDEIVKEGKKLIENNK